MVSFEMLKPENNNQNVNYISFASDQSIMNIGTKSGFKIFSLEPIQLLIEKDIEYGIKIIQSLLQYNYIFYVTSQEHSTYDQKSLIIWDKKKQQIIKNYYYSKIIENLQISNNHIIIAFDDQIQCRSLNNDLVSYMRTCQNLNGLMAVSHSISFCVVAPAIEVGHVTIQWFKQAQINPRDTQTVTVPEQQQHTIQTTRTSRQSVDYACEQELTFKCNNSGVQYLSLNNLGNIVAVASQHGTLIRFFDTKTSLKTKEFRRGSTYASISYMTFNVEDNLFACCSQKDTIHLFRLNEVNNTSYFGILSSILPIVGDEWSFAQINTPKNDNDINDYKIILRTGFAFITNNRQQYAVIQIPKTASVQVSSFENLI